MIEYAPQAAYDAALDMLMLKGCIEVSTFPAQQIDAMCCAANAKATYHQISGTFTLRRYVRKLEWHERGVTLETYKGVV